jgi:hydrogenase maturation protease
MKAPRFILGVNPQHKVGGLSWNYRVKNSSPANDIVVIGLGNVLLSDEGIGVHLIRQLSNQQDKFPLVEFVDAGTAGMNLLHLIANRKKAIILDCAKMGEKPGTIKRFTADEVVSVKHLAHFSLHEIDILQVLNLSKQLGECPDEVVFFGIEPESLSPGQNLSKTLSAKIDVYIAAVCEELR